MKIPEYIKEILDGNPNIGRISLAKQANISEQEARFYCKLHKWSNNKPVKRGVAVGDIHFPVDNQECRNILFDFIRDFEPDIVILSGDQMDMDSISIHNAKKPKLIEGKRLHNQYRRFQSVYLSHLEKIKHKYFMIGNHEYRVDRLIENSPQYEGFVEVDKNLDLQDWTVVPFNECLSLGEMNFIHGHYWNKYHANKNVSVYGKNIFSWHAHTSQSFTMYSPVNHLPRMGVSIGCMCNKNPDWLRDKPNNWVNQFMFFYLFGDGSFTFYIPTIINGKCFINNKLYVGKV
jgi:hypothetical protein